MLPYALSVVSPGDTIFLRAGTYTGMVFVDKANITIRFASGGGGRKDRRRCGMLGMEGALVFALLAAMRRLAREDLIFDL